MKHTQICGTIVRTQRTERTAYSTLYGVQYTSTMDKIKVRWFNGQDRTHVPQIYANYLQLRGLVVQDFDCKVYDLGSNPASIRAMNSI